MDNNSPYTFTQWWSDFEQEIIKHFDGTHSCYIYTPINPAKHSDVEAFDEKKPQNFYLSMRKIIALANFIESNLWHAEAIAEKMEIIADNFNGAALNGIRPGKNGEFNTRKIIKPIDKDSLIMSILYLRHLKRMPDVKVCFSYSDPFGLINRLATHKMANEKNIASTNCALLEKAITAFCLDPTNDAIVSELNTYLNDFSEAKLLIPAKTRATIIENISPILKTRSPQKEEKAPLNKRVPPINPSFFKNSKERKKLTAPKASATLSLSIHPQQTKEKGDAFSLINFICNLLLWFIDWLQFFFTKSEKKSYSTFNPS